MTIPTITLSFERAILNGEMDLSTDTLKLAFYNQNANLGEDTVRYSTQDEIAAFGSGASGYPTGGVTIPITISQDEHGTVINTADPAFEIAFEDVPVGTVFGHALLYNSTNTNENSIAVFDLRGQVVSDGILNIQLSRRDLGFDLIRLSST